MGSIPLPALDIGRQQAADPLGDIGKVVALRQLANQQQMQQQDLQIKQQQVRDLQATTAAMMSWDPKSQTYDDLAKSVLAKGGSANAATAIQQHGLDIRAKASQVAKLDAETGETNLKNLQTKNDLLLGAIDAAKQVPDEQLVPHVSATLDSLGQQGLVDPQFAGQAKQLLASGAPPKQIRQQLDILEKGLQGEKGQFDLAAKQAETYKNIQQGAAATQEAAKNAALLPSEIQIKQNEAANPPMSESQLYLKAAGGDPMAAVKLQTQQKIASRPINMSTTNLLQDQTALDQQAERFAQTGQLPAGFSRSPATTAAIIKRSAELHPGQNLASNSAEFKANEGSLKKLQTNFDQVSAFEGTALKNLDLFVQKASAIPDLGARFANVPLRQITGKMIGDKNQAALNAARQTAATEAAKVLGSATASGVLSDTQKKDALDVLDGNLPMPAMVAVVNTLKQDFANRHASYDAQIGAIKSRMGGTSQPAATAPASSAPVTKVYQGATYAQQPDGSWKKQ